MEKILIIDDEPRVLEAFKRHLMDEFDVLTGSSTEEGLEIIKAHKDIAVILSDYRMPGRDGIEFLAEASQILPDSIRIMITGFADVDNAMKAVNEGRVFKFLTKPVAIKRLIEIIQEGINEYRINQTRDKILDKTVGHDAQKVQEFLQRKWQTLHYEIINCLRKKESSYASPVDSSVLGDELNITPSYIRGIIRPLIESGLVGVRMGRRGGYYLAVDQDLLDNYEKQLGSDIQG